MGKPITKVTLLYKMFVRYLFQKTKSRPLFDTKLREKWRSSFFLRKDRDRYLTLGTRQDSTVVVRHGEYDRGPTLLLPETQLVSLPPSLQRPYSTGLESTTSLPLTVVVTSVICRTVTLKELSLLNVYNPDFEGHKIRPVF